MTNLSPDHPIPTSIPDNITPLVARVMTIESVILGDPQNKYLARFQGHLIDNDSTAAYDQLVKDLRPLEITPLFRVEEGRHTIILMPGVTHPRPSKAWVNLVLFILTVLSTFLVGAAYTHEGAIPTSLAEFLSGWPFAVSLLAILLSHEFGHYLMARYHHTAATLPYFIPLPLPGSFGTMGAVIIQKEAHRNKRILLDIGMAGPFAGLIVAIPILLLGLSLSQIDQLPTFLQAGQGIGLEGNSVLYLLAKFIVFKQWLPTPASFGGLPPVIYWLKYFFTGQPTPLGGIDVTLSPVALAGWAGLLVTALNLIPAGQLDGGHIIHGLLGKRAEVLRPVILILLVLLGLVWPGWFLWAFLIFFLGRSYADPLDQITPLNFRRKALAVLGLIVFLLVFTPVPQRIIIGGIR